MLIYYLGVGDDTEDSYVTLLLLRQIGILKTYTCRYVVGALLFNWSIISWKNEGKIKLTINKLKIASKTIFKDI